MTTFVFILIAAVCCVIDSKRLIACGGRDRAIYIILIISACAVYAVSQINSTAMLGTFQFGGVTH